MTLAADTALLREPNLWVPGKAPVGKVRIKKDHPLAENVVSFILPIGGKIVDLAANRPPDLTTGNIAVDVVHGEPAMVGGAVAWRLGNRSFDCAQNGFTHICKLATSNTSLFRAHNIANEIGDVFHGVIKHIGGNIRYQGTDAAGVVGYTDGVIAYPIDEAIVVGQTTIGNQATRIVEYEPLQIAQLYRAGSFASAGGFMDIVCFRSRYYRGRFNSVYDGPMYWGVVLDRVISREFFYRLAINPFQLLEPA